MKNRYFKTTQGLEAQVFVAKAVAYATATTFAAFVTAGLEGQIGIFLFYDISGPTTYTQATAALNASDAALQAGDKFFIAQIVDGKIKKTPIYTYSENTVRQVAYLAPVLQITNIGYGSLSATTGSMNSGTLINGQIFPVKLIDNRPASQPFPTWNYEETSKQGDTFLSIGTRLTKQMNDTVAAQNQYNGKLVRAELLTNGTYVASSGGAATMVKDSKTFTIVESAGAAADAGKYAADASSMAIGDYIRIGGTTAASPIYKIAGVSGIGSALATITLDSDYQAASGSVSAANLLVNTAATVTEFGFKFTAIDYGASFKVGVEEDLISADVVYTTPYKEGIGTSDQVTQLEIEGQVFDGHTTINEAFDADFGAPTSYTVSGTTYQFVYLDYLRSLPSIAAPKINDSNYGHIILALPVGVAPTSDLDGIFV